MSHGHPPCGGVQYVCFPAFEIVTDDRSRAPHYRVYLQAKANKPLGGLGDVTTIRKLTVSRLLPLDRFAVEPGWWRLLSITELGGFSRRKKT